MAYSHREITEYFGLAPCESGSGYPRADVTMRELTPLACLHDSNRRSGRWAPCRHRWFTHRGLGMPRTGWTRSIARGDCAVRVGNDEVCQNRPKM